MSSTHRAVPKTGHRAAPRTARQATHSAAAAETSTAVLALHTRTGHRRKRRGVLGFLFSSGRN